METLKDLVTQFNFQNETYVVVIPLILMCLDIMTGLINAWIKGEVDSSKLRKGLGKKLGEITCILIGEIFVVGFGLTAYIAAGVSIYIIVMELISICENLEKLGVPIPKFIKKALMVANTEINEDDKKDDSKEDEEK
jgi:toxin secretion/phage lysis holin